jgi:hypothetical protein
MDNKKPAKENIREGLDRILEKLEVTGEAVILDKDGNVKRRMKIRRINPLQENEDGN